MTAAAIPAAGAPELAVAEAPSLALAPPPAPETTSAHVFVIPAYNEEENIPRLLADLEARPALFPCNTTPCLLSSSGRMAAIRGARGVASGPGASDTGERSVSRAVGCRIGIAPPPRRARCKAS